MFLCAQPLLWMQQLGRLGMMPAEHTPEEATMQRPTAPQQAPTTNSQLTIDDLMRHAGQRQSFLSSSQPRLVRTAGRRRRRSLRFRRRQLRG